MGKYLFVAKYTWNEFFTYRLNFVMWRIRLIFQLLTLYYLWFSVLPNNQEILGYDLAKILTYVLLTHIMGSFIFSTRTSEIGENINNGDLTIFLLRPINYFGYWFSRDLGDKAMNSIFSLVEFIILLFLLRPPIFIQENILFLFLSIFAIMLAIIMYYFVNVLLGFVAFWSQETWAPRFIFFVLITFLAGAMFPLDILPKFIFTIINLLPFTYLLYFPIKVYLGQLPIEQILSGFIISLIWIIVMYLITKFVWDKGLKVYTAFGR